MKETTKLRIKNFFADSWLSIKVFFIFLFSWIRNMWVVFILPSDTIRYFEGWGHFWLAKKYADIRHNRTKHNKYAGGKVFYVLPYGDVALIVLCNLELKYLKNKGAINKSVNIVEVLKHAYYIAGEATKPKPLKNSKLHKHSQTTKTKH